MGWASGSRVMSDIVMNIRDTGLADEIKDDVRQALYGILIEAFQDADCDTLDECLDIDPAFDKAYANFYPDEEEDWEFEDEDDEYPEDPLATSYFDKG